MHFRVGILGIILFIYQGRIKYLPQLPGQQDRKHKSSLLKPDMRLHLLIACLSNSYALGWRVLLNCGVLKYYLGAC